MTLADYIKILQSVPDQDAIVVYDDESQGEWVTKERGWVDVKVQSELSTKWFIKADGTYVKWAEGKFVYV